MCCFISAVETQLLASVLNLTCIIFMIKTIAHPSMLLLNELFLKENFKTFFFLRWVTRRILCVAKWPLFITTEARVLTAFQLYDSPGLLFKFGGALVYARLLSSSTAPGQWQDSLEYNGNRGWNWPDALHKKSGPESDGGAFVWAVFTGANVSHS